MNWQLVEEPDPCACGQAIEEVSLAHYLSCGPDAAFGPEEASGFVGRLAARVQRASADDIEGGGE